MPCVLIFRKNGQLWLFRSKFAQKIDFGVGISKIKVQIRNLHFQDTMCTNFQFKRATLTFLAQICPKRKLGFEIQETNVGIRISILEIQWVPIFRQNGHFEFLGPNLPKNRFWGWNFKNLSPDLESISLRHFVHQFSDKTDNFEFLGPNLLRNGFWGLNFKSLSLDSESTPPKYHVCQVSVKMDNF